MDIKVTRPNLAYEYGAGWVLSFLVDRDSASGAKRIIDELKEKPLRLSAREWKERRSLSANAYFHVLVGKIAEKMGLGEDEVKRSLVLDYGALMRDPDGDVICIPLPKGADPGRLGVQYTRFVYETEDRNCYLVYAPTHTYDTKEFSRLLDGAIQEARDLGIEVLPPAELERMMASYEKENPGTGNSSKGEAVRR